MVYSPTPPYEILQTKLIDFPAMQRMRRFAKYWDMVANSGNFVRTTPMLLQTTNSPFAGFLRFTDWLYSRVGKQHGIALSNLVELVFRFLTDELRCDGREITPVLLDDYQRGGRSDVPPFLRMYLPQQLMAKPRDEVKAPKRQARHLA